MAEKIYTIDTRKISCEIYRTAYFCMSDERQRKCREYKNENDRRLCIAADYLLRKIMSEKTGIRGDEFIFSADERGKPFCVNCPLPVSISHSGNMAAAAVGTKNSIGIDIERIKPVKSGIMKYFCSPVDIEYIGILPDAGKIAEDKEVLERLFRVWTFKEAYVKCRGTGIKDPDMCSIDFPGMCAFSDVKDGYAMSLYEE